MEHLKEDPLQGRIGITHKHQTRLKRFARDKHSSLFSLSIRDKEKNVQKLRASFNVKMFFSISSLVLL